VVSGLAFPPATARLRLRQLREDDLPAFRALNADPRVMEFFPRPLSAMESDTQAARIWHNMEEHGFSFWAVELPGVAPFIGLTGLSIPSFQAPFTPCVEIGWRFATAYWGQGYATEAANAALSFGFSHLGLAEIVAFTVPANIRSRRVMERLGMTHDSADDFDHPNLAPDHRLRRHVLYRRALPPISDNAPCPYLR
jgi:RimJ/RimL family protein N-acetyltransferase